MILLSAGFTLVVLGLLGVLALMIRGMWLDGDIFLAIMGVLLLFGLVLLSLPFMIVMWGHTF